MATWAIEPDVDITVLVQPVGPFDNPSGAPLFDVTDYVRGQGITINRGRSDEFTAFQAGTCTFTLKNNNREFDPTNASSPFADILKPLRRVFISVSYQDVTYVPFTGYIDGWPRTWTKTTGSVQISARDAMSVMARAITAPSSGVLTLDDPVHGRLDSGRLAGVLPDQFTGERAVTLLQLAGFTVGAELQADTGLTQVLGLEPTGNILQLVQEAELAEAGFFFVDREGVIRFHDRHSRFQKPRTANVQAVFTDSQYAGLEVDRNLNQVWNDVTFSRPPPEGFEQDEDAEHTVSFDSHFTNQESLHDYGILSYQQEIPVLSDGETLGRAEFWVNRYGEPQDRPSPITVRPRRDMPTLFPACVGRELLDRIQIERTPLGIGPAATFTGLVEQIEHRITNVEWETTLTISPIDVDEGAGFLILNDATDGQLDVGLIAY